MREGYKETAIGEIPEDWEVFSLDDIKKQDTTISYGVVQPGLEDNNGVLFIRGGDIKNGKISKELRTISTEISTQYSRTILQGGEILVSLVGYPGECAVVPNRFRGANIARQVGMIRVATESNVYYLQQYLSSPIGKKNVLGNLVGSAQQVINLNMLRRVDVPLPPLPEQLKIAEILTTVDDKIDVIDQQISETKKLKKGLMQRLLTKGIGHTRFKDSPLGEIPENWELVDLKSLLNDGKNITYGIVQPGEYIEDGIYLIRSQDYTKGWLPISNIMQVSHEVDAPYKRSRVQEGDILITVVGANVGRIAVVPKELHEANISRSVARISISKNLANSSFIRYYLESNGIETIIRLNQVGGAQPVLNLKELSLLKIPKPTIQEQEKVASILTTIDNKLDLLSEKKTFYQELKKGLMQQLLTGNIRVNGLISKTAIA